MKPPTTLEMMVPAKIALQALRGAAASEFKKAPNEQSWTTSILRALASLAPEGACIDPDVSAPRNGSGRAAKEYLWDLTISSWPNYETTPYAYPSYFERAAQGNSRLLLVAESEWGAATGHKKNGMAVMEDFSKLLGARAPLKVMVFSYFRTGASSTFEELSALMVKLIRATGDDAEYVLFGVAWGKDSECKDMHIRRDEVSDVSCGP